MKEIPVNITNDYLNLIIGISTLIIALISFGIEIGEYKFFKFFKSLSFRIPVLIFFSSIIIWATVIKDKNNDVRNSNDLLLRDSLNQAKFDKSLSKASGSQAAASAEIMAKYYLKYDSTQRLITKILKDSSKNKVAPELNPEFDVVDIGGKLSNDTIHVVTYFSVTQAPVDFVQVKLDYVLRDGNSNYDNKNLFYSPAQLTIFRNKMIPNNNLPVKTIENKFYNATFGGRKMIVYVHVVGLYKSEKGKNFNFESLNYYNVDSKEFGELSPKEYNWIYSYIRSKAE